MRPELFTHRQRVNPIYRYLYLASISIYLLIYLSIYPGRASSRPPWDSNSSSSSQVYLAAASERLQTASPRPSHIRYYAISTFPLSTVTIKCIFFLSGLPRAPRERLQTAPPVHPIYDTMPFRHFRSTVKRSPYKTYKMHILPLRSTSPPPASGSKRRPPVHPIYDTMPFWPAHLPHGYTSIMILLDSIVTISPS